MRDHWFPWILKSQFASNIDLRWLDINGKLLKFVIWYDNEWGYAVLPTT